MTKKNFGTYKNSDAALDAVKNYYFHWTEYLTKSSFPLSCAIIGANWAINFSKVEQIENNLFSEWSVVLAILNIVINVFLAWLFSREYKTIADKACENPEQWQRDFEKYNNDGSSPWPFSKRIECAGVIGQFTKTWLPIISGCLFIFSVIFK